MGKGKSKLPAIPDSDMKSLLAYNIREDHIRKLLKMFKKVDADYTGTWGVSEMFSSIQEPRISVRAPIIDALFFMGDSRGKVH